MHGELGNGRNEWRNPGMNVKIPVALPGKRGRPSPKTTKEMSEDFFCEDLGQRKRE